MANMHLIGKQVFELKLGTSENSYALQKNISQMVWQDLAPKMARLFDESVDVNHVIRFDKIELDLGAIDLKDGKVGKLADKIMEQLQKELADKIHIPNVDRPLMDFESHKGLLLPTRKHAFDIWLYWLERGSLPSYSISPGTNWLKQVFETLGLEHKAISLLAETIKKSPFALERLVLQHSRAELRSLVELYTGFSQIRLPQIINEVLGTLKGRAKTNRSLTPTEVELVFWRLVVQQVILEQKKLNSMALATEIFKRSPLAEILPHLRREIKTKDGSIPLLKELLNTLPANLQIPDPTGENNEVGSMASDPTFLETPQFFKEAGVILLHPFLGTLFNKLGFMEEGDFKDHQSRARAVLLIHFLASGKEKLAEYDMVLPKFLCAMSVNLPVDHRLRLTRKEKDAAYHLLEAAISHWGVLGNTSPDGLREGFLMRDGKLEKEHSGWKLFVEQKAQDILLDKIPWNLSLVKLPWMKELLYVEWR